MPTPDLSAIGAHAASTAERIEGVSQSDRLDIIEVRIDDLEYVLEEVSLETKFRNELAGYIRDLREESRLIKKLRIVSGGFAGTAACALFVAPIIISWKNFEWFSTLPEYVKSSLIISMFASGVILTLAVTKSVYRSAAERHSDDFVPPQLKLIHELISGGKG